MDELALGRILVPHVRRPAGKRGVVLPAEPDERAQLLDGVAGPESREPVRGGARGPRRADRHVRRVVRVRIEDGAPLLEPDQRDLVAGQGIEACVPALHQQ